MKRRLLLLGAVVLVGSIGAALAWRRPVETLPAPLHAPVQEQPVQEQGEATETIIRTDYRPPPPEERPLVVADRLADKNTTFDPDLVDRRPEGDWLVNLSEAVIALDAPLILPDLEPGLLVLYPSYAAAIAKSSAGGAIVLASVNMIDGKAKQFDDGLVAALEQAILQRKSSRLPDPISVVKRLLANVGPSSVAAPFLAAGLTLIGETVAIAPALANAKRGFLNTFEANEVLSKPIGFYTWNKMLSDGYRFRRFFQQTFDSRDLAIPRALATALGRDQALRDDYHRVIAFNSGLTNRPDCLSLNDLLESDAPPASGQRVAIFPPSGSRETDLFHKLFPRGLPPGADLMRALIECIRSGGVDLSPRGGSGWYEHQVHALETLLLPEKGDESRKLLLTAPYKLRMLEAFKALMTKRRETHVLPAAPAPMEAPPEPLKELAPRLRLEPCPSFYLRTARAYAFLVTFLDSAVGADALRSVHGLREGGERPAELDSELASMRDLFYGLALLSAEDIGMRLELHDDEPLDRDQCEKRASEWLEHAWVDPDLGIDTRVSAPIYVDPVKRVTGLWATLGVRMNRLTARYARPPRIKPNDAKESDGWQVVEPAQLITSNYLIPVDEFAAVTLRGTRVLTRKELRAACDANPSKEAIVSALER
jgi:hypothetical protein